MELLKLVAYGLKPHPCQILKINRVAYEYCIFNQTTYDTNDNIEMIIPRVSEIIMLEYIEFENISEDFINELRNTILTIKIGALYSVNLPLNLLMNLSKPTICDNKLYLKTHIDTFFGNIPSIAIPYDLVSVVLNNRKRLEPFIKTFNIISNLLFLDTQERRELAINDFTKTYQKISHYYYDKHHFKVVDNKYILKLSMDALCKGIFIEINEIAHLSEIKLITMSNERLVLNKFMIQTMCEKINENMIYFPFNMYKSFRDTSNSSFEGALNISSDDFSIELHLKYDNNKEIDKINLYNINGGIFTKTNNNIELK
jgi:hypothetical protein